MWLLSPLHLGDLSNVVVTARIHCNSSRRAPPAEGLPGALGVGGDPEAHGDPNLPAQSPLARRSRMQGFLGGWCLADKHWCTFNSMILLNLIGQ